MSDIIYTPPATAGTTGSGAAGQVTFWTAPTVLSGDNDLFWDNTNKRLGVGTTTPAYKLDVNGTARVQTSLQISGAVDGSVFFPNTVSGQQFRIYTQYASNAMVLFANGFNINMSGGGGMTSNFTTTITGQNGSPALTVQQGNVAWTPVLKVNAIGSTGSQFNTNGNVLIGTTTDAGYKLDVNGTSIFRSTTEHTSHVALLGNNLYLGSLFGNTVLRPVSTTNLQLLNSNGGATLFLNANGVVQIGQSNVTYWASFSATGHTIYGTTNTYFFSNGNVSINQSVDAGYKFQVNGTAYINSNLYLGNARVGFSQSVPYFDIVASFTGGAGFSIGFVDNNNTNRWATWKYNGSAMSDYTSTPTPVNSSVQFQLDSISRGFLLARMTDAQILAIASPATGIMVYSTDQNHIAYFDGTVWKKLNNSNL